MRKSERMCERVLALWLNQHELELTKAALQILARGANELETRNAAGTLAQKLLNLEALRDADELRQRYVSRDWKSQAEIRDMEF